MPKGWPTIRRTVDASNRCSETCKRSCRIGTKNTSPTLCRAFARSITEQHLPIYNDTDHLYDLHIPFKGTSIVSQWRPPHEWFDDDVGIDGTIIFKLVVAKSQNNSSPRYWSHRVVLDNPSASVLPSAIYADGVPHSHDDSVIGFWPVNIC